MESRLMIKREDDDRDDCTICRSDVKLYKFKETNGVFCGKCIASHGLGNIEEPTKTTKTSKKEVS